jgi:hydroxysqualene synthase
MTSGPVWDPGEKTHRDENFPVASHLVSKRHRGIILAFYRFARAADDIADDPALSETQKIAKLGRFEETLLGGNDEVEAAIGLRTAIKARGLTPKHGQDLLHAFKMDSRKRRYTDWDDLMGYCTYSAMPVGRFVLDVHGESRSAWPANDALCAGLQIINHLQDCGADYRRLNRVYIPLDVLAKHGAAVEDLAGSRASRPLLAAIWEVAGKTEGLLRSHSLARGVKDLRLSLEVGAIERLAKKLVRLLKERDPLSQTVHLGQMASLSVLVTAACLGLAGRIFPSGPRADAMLENR